MTAATSTLTRVPGHHAPWTCPNCGTSWRTWLSRCYRCQVTNGGGTIVPKITRSTGVSYPNTPEPPAGESERPGPVEELEEVTEPASVPETVASGPGAGTVRRPPVNAPKQAHVDYGVETHGLDRGWLEGLSVRGSGGLVQLFAALDEGRVRVDENGNIVAVDPDPETVTDGDDDGDEDDDSGDATDEED